MKKTFLISAIALVVCGILLGGCCMDPKHKSINEKGGSSNNFETEKRELQTLARKVGIPESKIQTLSATGLIYEIRGVLDQPRNFYGKTLSDEQRDALNIRISNNPEMRDIIMTYHEYLKQIKGKNVIILP